MHEKYQSMSPMWPLAGPDETHRDHRMLFPVLVEVLIFSNSRRCTSRRARPKRGGRAGCPG